MVVCYEGGVVFMVDGYICEIGRIGVCCVIFGFGVINLIIGVVCVFDNDILMLVIIGQLLFFFFGKCVLQELVCIGINILGMFQYCICYNLLVLYLE